MAQRNGSSDTGILRKKVPIENHDELLVFGYACKLFRDDEKAIFIDQGKHLIPWMGDETIKIDRYDCRGALADLRKYEASKEGFDAMRWLGLSDKEINLEELCDKERYYSLEINEEEEEMYKEEEQKRKKTNAVQYSYDVQNLNTKSDGIPTVPEEEEVEEEYIPSPILDVPVDIEIPKTVKEYARIEKTALFVCNQGLQMEILIKAKQSDNPQFGFLNQGDPLYKFYRHVLAAFKNGRYQGYEPRNKNKTDVPNDDMVQDSSSHYLHPSLTSSSTPEPDPSTAVSIPHIPYKPSVNCAYSQLVNRIQGSQNDNQDSPKSTTTTIPDFGQMTYEQQQYYQYYYAQQYYEYYKQMALYQQGQGGNPGQFIPPPDFQNLDPNIQNYIQQIAYNEYLQQLQQTPPSDSNSYAQIVTNVSKDNNPYAMIVPQLVQNVSQEEDSKTIVYGPDPKPEEDVRKVTKVDKSTDKAEVMLRKPILSLAVYGSSSESDDETSEEEPKEQHEKKEVYEIPSGETQIVIDKMAVYVSKNGEQFEEIVKAKGDPRFDFLNGTHQYNKYYKEKIKELKGELTSRDEQKDKKDVKEVKKVKKEKKVIAPVSFSIKKAKEEPPKEIKSALPMEESDEDEDSAVITTTAPIVSTEKFAQNTSTATPPSLVSVLLKYAENQKNTNKTENQKNTNKTIDTITIIHEDVSDEKEVEEIKMKKNESQKTDNSEGDDLILEMIELTGEIKDKQEKKTEDKLKDKLAAAAREKLALMSKDRALQLERKKKAAAFLKLKSAQINLKTNESQKPKLPSKQDSIEIIEIDLDDDEESPETKEIERVKNRSKRSERKMGTIEMSSSRERSRSRDKEKRKQKKKSSRSKEKSRVKEKKRGECSEEDEDYRRKDDERRERKKKSHKRKHSKSRHDSKNKKKSKKRHKKSESDSSDSTDNSS